MENKTEDEMFEKALEGIMRIGLGFIVNTLPTLLLMFQILKFVAELILPNILFDTDHKEWWYIFELNLVAFGIMAYFGLFTAEVAPNQAKVYKGVFSGILYCKWPGFNWTTPLQSFFNSYNTAKHEETTDKGDSDTQGEEDAKEGDSMPWSWVVMWMIDVRDVWERNSNLKKFIKATVPNIEKDIKRHTNSLVTAFTWEITAEEAKTDRIKEGLSITDYKNICEKYGILVYEATIEDLDFSETLREARKNGIVMDSMAKSAEKLTKVNNDSKNSWRIVKAKYLDGNYKEIEVTGDKDTKVHLQTNA